MQFALTAAAKIYMRVYSGSWTSWTSGIEAVTDLPTSYNEGDVYVKV
jgi:3-mercaptopyruvate sulfurtransferase SseA